jgi:hypothetical protein
MSRRPAEPQRPLSLRFIAEWEARVAGQKQLLHELKRKRQPTHQAEANLLRCEQTLLQLRNHLEIIQELAKPNRYENNLTQDSRDGTAE